MYGTDSLFCGCLAQLIERTPLYWYDNPHHQDSMIAAYGTVPNMHPPDRHRIKTGGCWEARCLLGKQFTDAGDLFRGIHAETVDNTKFYEMPK